MTATHDDRHTPSPTASRAAAPWAASARAPSSRWRSSCSSRIPFVAILVAVPVAWGGWLGWSDVVLSFVMYAVSGHGITVGFHRYFTHGSFKAKRAAADRPRRRRQPGRSRVRSSAGWPTTASTTSSPTRRATRTRPWRYGKTVPALIKGLWHAHMGWLFDVEQTPQRQYAPDLLKDRDIVRVCRAFPLLAAASLLPSRRSSAV